MIELRPVLFVAGMLLTALALAMLIPTAADALAGRGGWLVFLGSAAVTLFIGVGLVLANYSAALELTIRDAFLLTTLSWIIVAAFAALPFAFSDLGLSYGDAFFEAMSGITTTGATVIVGLDSAPPGILVWRGLLEWLGGIGIIVVALAILPFLQVSGMQLFHTEFSDRSEKVLPRVTQIAAAIGALYLVLSVACFLSLWGAGMEPFDAFAHALTTISTGGFSTSDESIAHFASAEVELVIILFMIVGSLPFALYLDAVRGRPQALWRDSQVRAFVAVLAVAAAALFLWQWLGRDLAFAAALRSSTFNTVSIITGTGFATADYGLWGGFAVVVFFFFMFLGGCAGSTSCGIKMFHLQVLFATASSQMQRLLLPHGVFVAHYNRRPIPTAVSHAVMSFFFLFLVTYVILTLALTALGLDFLTSVSSAAAAITNVGPALGPTTGPAGTYAALPAAAKWLLAAGMLLGRLELLTVLVLFTPRFWRA